MKNRTLDWGHPEVQDKVVSPFSKYCGYIKANKKKHHVYSSFIAAYKVYKEMGKETG